MTASRVVQGTGPRVKTAGGRPTVVRRCDSYHDLLPLHEALPARYPHLLESVVHGRPHARFDILFAFPGQTLELDYDFTLNGPAASASGDFLDALDRWWRSNGGTGPQGDDRLPFRGGWFVYLSYELGAQIEPTVPFGQGTSRLPRACAMRIPAAVIRDHWTKRTILVAEPGYAHYLDTMSQDLAALPRPRRCGTAVPVDMLDEDAPGAFLDGVTAIKRYIRDGDVFQVNLSRGWSGVLRPGVSPGDVYRRLRRHNPAPFAGLARFKEFAVVSSSPERLVRVTSGGTIETRPIAGTHPRGADAAADLAIATALLAHPKERAEHIMLIDLERNDLGRVCRPGTVAVNELMGLESYSHVHHIVSNVRGGLHPGVTPGQVVRAVFPGGTITGCPKVRCMQIIAELEGTPRGPYTGAMGYLNGDGSMDLNILIRTLWLDGRRLVFRTGAGIVADSQPESELQETRAKAKGLLMALNAP